MDSHKFDALVASIKNGDFKNTHTFFSQCTMIWPDQISQLQNAAIESNLRHHDLLLHQKISAFISIYTDAVNGKLQWNDHYLSCFKTKR